MMAGIVSPKRRCGLLVCGLAVAAAALAGRVDRAAAPDEAAVRNAAPRTVTVYRDRYGVPHVWGATDASVVFGFVYAQAEDNFWRIEDNYIRALGRSAEVHGPSEVPQDLMNASLDIPGRARQDYAASSVEVRRIADAVAAALNRFLEQQPDVQPRLLRRFEPWYTFALVRYFTFQQFAAGRSGLQPAEVMAAFKAAEHRSTDSASGDAVAMPLATPGADATDSEAIRAVAEREGFRDLIGSTAWAIGRKRTDRGGSMLFINPHLPFNGPLQLYEGYLHSEEGLAFAGPTFLGLPLPLMGYSDRLGWGFVANCPDIVDLYEERFDDASRPLEYRYQDGYRTASSRSVSLKIRAPDGTLAERTWRLRATHHGPLLGIRDGKLLTARFSKAEDSGQLQQWLEMARADSLNEFKKAMARLSFPLLSVVYADRDGNIFYVYNGAIPRRRGALNWKEPLDGSRSDTEWDGYHRFDELPQVTNPESAFVQSANSTPLLAAGDEGLRAGAYPPYMFCEIDTVRAQVSRTILTRQQRFDFDRWATVAFNSEVGSASSEIAKLADEWKTVEPAEGGERDELAAAVDELVRWNGVSDRNSVAMTLFSYWQVRPVVTEGSGAPAMPPRVAGLARAINQIKSAFGTWRTPWGEVNRLQRADPHRATGFADTAPSLPVRGGTTGMIFSFFAVPAPGQKRLYGTSGGAYTAVVEFGGKFQARSITVFGASSDPSSKHYFDQATLYADGQFKPAWWSLDDVKRNTDRVLRLTFP